MCQQLPVAEALWSGQANTWHPSISMRPWLMVAKGSARNCQKLTHYFYKGSSSGRKAAGRKVQMLRRRNFLCSQSCSPLPCLGQLAVVAESLRQVLCRLWVVEATSDSNSSAALFVAQRNPLSLYAPHCKLLGWIVLDFADLTILETWWTILNHCYNDDGITL